MVQPLLIVDAPAIQPYMYGLESVAVPQPTDDFHWEMGVEYESIGQYLTGLWPGVCFDAEPVAASGASGVPITQGLPFAVNAGVSCSIVGYTEQYILSRAQAILKLGWQNGAEKALWTGSVSNSPALTSNSALPGASGVSWVSAISQLEAYLGANYLGRGVIHVPRGGAAYLSNTHAIDRGNSLQTILGTQFVFGGGYPNTGPGGVAAPPGYMWIWASGMVGVRRGEPFIPGGLAQWLNRNTNIQNVTAQQQTVLTLDGPVMGALVNLSAAEPD